VQETFADKWALCRDTNPQRVVGGIEEALRGADVVVAFSRPGPDVITPAAVVGMNKDAIVFACANPVPEIWPWDAKEAGARIVATGRGDLDNQVNNSLGFPGIFRGTLDVRATTITDSMALAAAGELADFARAEGLSEEHIVPSMAKWEVVPRIAAAVGMQAVSDGVAQVLHDRETLVQRATEIISKARETVAVLGDAGILVAPPPDVDAEA
jgi:malate dehydrogenase (oxaloacetate-decarboxylating)